MIIGKVKNLKKKNKKRTQTLGIIFSSLELGPLLDL